MTKKKEKKVEENSKRINLFQTSYHFYRNFIRKILANGKVTGFSFLKNEKIGRVLLHFPQLRLKGLKKCCLILKHNIQMLLTFYEI